MCSDIINAHSLVASKNDFVTRDARQEMSKLTDLCRDTMCLCSYSE